VILITNDLNVLFLLVRNPFFNLQIIVTTPNFLHADHMIILTFNFVVLVNHLSLYKKNFINV